MNTNPLDLHRLISTNMGCKAYELNIPKPKDSDEEVIGLEAVFEPKDWHRWVYGGDTNPNT